VSAIAPITTIERGLHPGRFSVTGRRLNDHERHISHGARERGRDCVQTSFSSASRSNARRSCSARVPLRDFGSIGPAPLLRLRGRHRAQLVAKTSEPRRIARAAASLLEAATPALRRDGLTAVVDVDPQSL